MLRHAGRRREHSADPLRCRRSRLPRGGTGTPYYHSIGRAEYTTVTDEEALEAFQVLSKAEGIIPALESAHAVAYAMKVAPKMERDQIIVVNLSGRGDKDVEQVFRLLNT